MITSEFTQGDMIGGHFPSSLWDSPVVVRQPGDESPGYYQDAPPGHPDED